MRPPPREEGRIKSLTVCNAQLEFVGKRITFSTLHIKHSPTASELMASETIVDAEAKTSAFAARTTKFGRTHVGGVFLGGSAIPPSPPQEGGTAALPNFEGVPVTRQPIVMLRQPVYKLIYMAACEKLRAILVKLKGATKTTASPTYLFVYCDPPA